MEADHSLIVREGVVAIISRNTQVLLIQRGSEVPFAGYWAPLSGKVERGESIEDALVREVEEEVGFIVKPVRKLWESVSQDGLFRLHWWSASIIGGALRPDEREVADVRWIEARQHATLVPTFESDRTFFEDVFPGTFEADPVEQRIGTVLFDFDYTLADSSAGVIECANYALRRIGSDEAEPERIRHTIGLSLRATFERLAPSMDPTASAAFETAFVERADQVMAELTQPYPDVAPTLKRLRDEGLALGIVSTKFRYRIEHILGMHGLASEFSVIVGGEDVTHQKPEPDALLLACRQLGASHAEVIYVGDHYIDAIAAHAAGIPMVAVLTGTCVASDFEDRAPVSIIQNLSELRVR